MRDETQMRRTQKASENRNSDNEKTIDYLKNILGQEADGIKMEDLSLGRDFIKE